MHHNVLYILQGFYFTMEFCIICSRVLTKKTPQVGVIAGKFDNYFTFSDCVAPLHSFVVFFERLKPFTHYQRQYHIRQFIIIL